MRRSIRPKIFPLLAIVIVLAIVAGMCIAGSTRNLVPRKAVSIAATGLTHDTTIGPFSDRATRYILEVPNYSTGTPTTTVSLIDSNSVTVYTGSAHAENANYSIPIDQEVVGTYTMRLTLSGTAGAITTVYFTLQGY
jgi:hypothetical protein